LLEKHSLDVLANNTRTTTGLTTFRVKDPDPNAENGGDLLGIRIDILSTDTRSFKKPYYLFFSGHEAANLELKKHTIPAVVPLKALLSRYLPKDEHSDQHPTSSIQDLALFVQAVRKELVAQDRRDTIFKELQKMAESKKSRLESISTPAPGAKDLELQFSGGTLARLRLNVSGNIEKVIVRSNEEGVQGTRKRKLERSILGQDAHIEGLAKRLRSAGSSF
jgi:central kinetochore subunit Mal2/MCM21